MKLYIKNFGLFYQVVEANSAKEALITLLTTPLEKLKNCFFDSEDLRKHLIRKGYLEKSVYVLP